MIPEKTFLDYTKLGWVTIGDSMLIGTNGAVTHNVPNDTVVVKSPARVNCTLEEYLKKSVTE